MNCSAVLPSGPRTPVTVSEPFISRTTDCVCLRAFMVTVAVAFSVCESGSNSALIL